MSVPRLRIVHYVLVPAIVLAGSVLAYFTWQTAAQYTRLGEEALVQSTLLIVREKLDRIEGFVIAQDNAVFQLVNPEDPDTLETTWLPVAGDVSPSVKAVLLLDEEGHVTAFAMRGARAERLAFYRTFVTHFVAALELEDLPSDSLRHLQRTHDDTVYLFSYKRLQHGGRSYVAVAHHDTGYIVREEFPRLFATEEGRRIYNVIDANNRRVYGPSLADAGGFLVGHRFPTTLYEWRLQVAPEQAALLKARGRSRFVNEVALVATALLIILFGVVFLLYASEKEHRLNVLKAEFVANVSHELKTPLSVIRMFGDMLLTRRVRSEEKEREYLQIIARESERLSALIENVLDFAAVERGRRAYNLREMRVGDVATRAVEAFRHRMPPGSSDLCVEIANDLPAVPLDEQAVLLAVLNLLDNAAKYGGGTPIRLEVLRAGPEILIRVHDRGAGIPPEDLRRVFDRFYRSRRAAQARGSGIGLSIVKSVADAHGGRAWAENAAEGGAVVSITLPIPKHARATGGPPAGPATAPLEPTGGPPHV